MQSGGEPWFHGFDEELDAADPGDTSAIAMDPHHDVVKQLLVLLAQARHVIVVVQVLGVPQIAPELVVL